MTITSTFKADQFTLRETKDPDKYLAALADEAAIKLGREIFSKIGYDKVEELSNKEELPAIPLNKEHKYYDVYEMKLVIVPATFVESMFKTNPEFEPIIKELCH